MQPGRSSVESGCGPVDMREEAASKGLVEYLSSQMMLHSWQLPPGVAHDSFFSGYREKCQQMAAFLSSHTAAAWFADPVGWRFICAAIIRISLQVRSGPGRGPLELS